MHCDQYPKPWHVTQHGLDPDRTLCSQFFPHFHPERVELPRCESKPCGIFVASMSDPFDPYVHPDWRLPVLDVIGETPQHIYFWLTKRPDNIVWAELMRETHPPVWQNVVLGVTVTGGQQAHLADRLRADAKAHGWPGLLWISFEPLLGGVQPATLDGFDWIVVGALSQGNRSTVNVSHVQEIDVAATERGIPLFEKDNLGALWRPLRREWPAFLNAPEPRVGAPGRKKA